jgi:predicted phosphodiesterase
MIIGVYSDLHSNLPALKAMQKAAGTVDQWVALGDCVGLFPQINEVLDWQRQNNVVGLLGDHEQALLNGIELEGSYTANESLKKQIKVISLENLNMLSSYPESYDLELINLRIHFTHFLTNQSRKPAYKYTIDLSLLEKFYQGYNYIFFGHTHLPAVFYGRDSIFINPGSAGFPIDVERQCSMVVIDTEGKTFNFIRFSYDCTELIEAIKIFDYNKKLITYIENGHRWT